MGNGNDDQLKIWQSVWWHQADKAQIERIWADVVAHDKTKAVSDYMDVDHLVSHAPVTIGRYPGAAGAPPLTLFKIEVLPHPNTAPTELRVERTAASTAFVATVYLSYGWPLPKRKTAYAAVTTGLPEWSPAQKEKMMAVQLFHELIHARLILERRAEMPAKYRGMHDEFKAWAAYVSTPQAAASTAAFKAHLGQILGMTSTKQSVDDAFEHLLQEKFATQKAFDAFKVRASNAEIAHDYAAKTYSRRDVPESVRTLRDKKADALAVELESIYDELDKFNAAHPKAAPVQNAPANAPVNAPRKGTELLRRHWKSAFAEVTPWNPGTLTPVPDRPSWHTQNPIQRGAFGTPARVADPFRRPFSTPAIPTQFAHWQPPITQHSSPFGIFSPPPRAPVPPPRPMPPIGIPHAIAGPRLDPFRGPIRASASPPPWVPSRPVRFTPGTGAGWDPQHASFGGGRIDPVNHMRLDPVVYSPPAYQKLIPGFTARPGNFPNGWDLGSRDKPDY